MSGKRISLILMLVVIVCWASTALATNFVIPAGTKVIEAEAFYGNTMMTDVTLPEGLLSIQSKAFANTGLTNVRLPDSLQTVAEDAFEGCSGLKFSATEGTIAYVQAVQYGWIVPEKDTDGSTQIILPEKLTAGADLTILVNGPSSTLRHTVYLYNPENHWLESKVISSSSGKATWPGYVLEERTTYRVMVTTITSDAEPRAAVIRNIDVDGNKPAPSAMTLPETIPNRQLARLDVSMYEDVYLQIQLISATGESVGGWDIGTRDMGDEGTVDLDIWYETGYLQAMRISYSIYQDGLWSAMSNAVEIPVTEDEGILESLYELNCPKEIQNGQDMTVSFTYAEDVTFYSVSISEFSSEANSYNSEVYYTSSRNCTGSTELVIPGACLEAGEYLLHLHLETPRNGPYNYVQRIIRVTGERSGIAPTLSTSNNILYSEQDATLEVHTMNVDDAEVACLRIDYNNNGYSEIGYEYVNMGENGECSYRYRNYYELYEDGLVSVRASVKNENGWSPFSEPVTIVLKKPEQLEEAKVKVASEYRSGEDITFSFASIENARTYRVDLFGQYGNTSYLSIYSMDALPDKELIIPGYAISSGIYRLIVYAYAPGYKASEHTEMIHVIGKRPEASEVIPTFEELHVHRSASFLIDSENVSNIRIQYTYSSDNSITGVFTERLTPVDSQTEWKLYIEEYTGWQIELSFAMQSDGIWSEWKKLTYTILDAPKLDEPVIHAESEYEAGKDIILSFDAVEHATRYTYHLYSKSYDYDLMSWMSTSGSLHFSARDLNSGKYLLSVTASGEDYVSSTSTAEFSIVGVKASAPGVTVNKTIGWEDEAFTWSINNENADLIYYNVSTPSVSNWTSGSISPRGETTLFSRSHSDEGKYTYRFTVLENGKWTEWSVPITVTVNALPILERAVVEVNTSLTAGQDLVFRFAPVSGAESYRAFLKNIISGTTIYRWDDSDVIPNANLTVPGYLLTGGTYELNVTAIASEAKSSTETTLITVTGKRPQGPQITAETTPIRIRSTAVFLIDTPDAEAVQVKYQYYRNDNDYFGETMVALEATPPTTRWEHIVNRYNEGYQLSIGVSAKVDGIWSAWNYKEYTVEGLPLLDEAVIHVEKSYQAGTDITLSFDSVEHATRYEYRLYKGESTSSLSSNTGSAAASLFRNGYQMENGTYRFEVTALSDDYVSSTKVEYFVIEGERPKAPKVSISSSDVRVREYFAFTIDTTDASALRYRTNEYSVYGINVFEDSTVYRTYQYYSGSYSYQFCVQNEEGIWSDWTEAYPVTVTEYDPLDEPVIRAKSEYMLGEDITVEISPVQDATGYSVYLYDANGTSVISRSLNQAEGGTVTLNGYSIPRGSLTLRVLASNANVSSSISQPIRVISGTRPSAPGVIPPESTTLTSSGYITFQINAVEATKYAVRYYTVGNTNNPTYSEGTISEGESSANYRTYFSANSGTQVNYSFAINVDGVWSEWSTAITISAE